MEFEFKNRHLAELYGKGYSRKYQLPQEVLEKFFMGIQHIEAATSIYDFWKTASLKFEKLQSHENRYSIRLTRKYRLELEFEWEDDEKTRGRVFIMELSAHYGD